MRGGWPLTALSVVWLAAPLAGCDDSSDEIGGIETVSADSEMVLEAARFAAGALDRDGASLARVIRAEHQVIAGLAYYLEIELTDGTRWEVTALYNTEAEWELKESREIT
ncbi:hypothetical protein GCM10010923_02900 [Blastomonas marina]|uniref:Cystatin domain-containing protein n=1 Tax=Blastomonas marina TaxID=1867408 RepID=A0ABQ1F2Q2_9SPHN|nr:cystatin domain-containing protein [Blastomonas marina]GFZ98197.1 hypothetical protein GCM10010923_02900 [Blastomonas marina]